MYVTTNSAIVWKRVADENQRSVQILGRIAVSLFVLLLAASAYAYSATSQYGRMCSALESKAEQASAPSARELGKSIADSYCS